MGILLRRGQRVRNVVDPLLDEAVQRVVDVLDGVRRGEDADQTVERVYA
jgi:hypothetical protein